MHKTASCHELCDAPKGGLGYMLLTKRPENAMRLVPEDVRPLVWLGASASDQPTFDAAVRALNATRGFAKLFISLEPQVGPVDLGLVSAHAQFLDWVIIGGESGPKARPFDLQWARDGIRQCRQCREAGVAVFVKQLGARPTSDSDDDRRHCGDMNLPGVFELKLADSHGGNMAEWPEDLRVREMPT